ncbi:MAG: glycine C-acetyltransferase [Candidatus Magasanikbacteria bacterium CG_4_9_14_0_2_um_filter_42_11]|uniref:8-amino-7-oxononanoate synthase n=1 Tax=Candidatus Magasanikbacteria bacterium CG_4_9_14_0_2_um_filter_42_11 TaxID=1974643 RepID=A0A2M8FA89_9BACT|nr:MAG: glycine C-acetyltransferase [Candidatus Magasanikbacteria bacterium CG10_big_fil_rev_8_21_14_0_10_43_9]PIY92727.1 MAG: glycine C-acetyltransferase [Candidatus Magasanikbacteria bacterium CG_4_10_14_0_8_um_filter_42_12]PJC52642.1 MAG: glycine C-acetyltransferase [Candidatus Magasanikbacteria bacterium CG_4_9_14_0_2_um_filter_42_11]
MNTTLNTLSAQTVEDIKKAGLFKSQRVISTKQGSVILADGKELLNFCANNYLGLSGKEDLIDAAKKSLDEYGYGLSSVRFICGTQTIHTALEKQVAAFFHKEDAILFTSCWDANEGVFASLLTDQDAVISDALNHASLIDGIRLCKAERHVFKHMDMEDLEEQLKQTQEKHMRCIVTDGVFSMDGDIAPLKEICDLADKYDAFVVVDDAHASGFLGDTGRGAAEAAGVLDRVDVITTTFGKALGGATGGAVVASKEVVALLHQRARTTLFTNALPPVICGVTSYVLDYVDQHPELRETLWDNTRYFREKMASAGFTLPKSVHPIVPVIIGDAEPAMHMAEDMLAEGIYVIAFSYPVVPMGTARIRVQISASHTKEQIDQLVVAFEKLGKKYNIL